MSKDSRSHSDSQSAEAAVASSPPAQSPSASSKQAKSDDDDDVKSKEDFFYLESTASLKGDIPVLRVLNEHESAEYGINPTIEETKVYSDRIDVLNTRMLSESEILASMEDMSVFKQLCTGQAKFILDCLLPALKQTMSDEHTSELYRWIERGFVHLICLVCDMRSELLSKDFRRIWESPSNHEIMAECRSLLKPARDRSLALRVNEEQSILRLWSLLVLDFLAGFIDLFHPVEMEAELAAGDIHMQQLRRWPLSAAEIVSVANNLAAGRPDSVGLQKIDLYQRLTDDWRVVFLIIYASRHFVLRLQGSEGSRECQSLLLNIHSTMKSIDLEDEEFTGSLEVYGIYKLVSIAKQLARSLSAMQSNSSASGTGSELDRERTELERFQLSVIGLLMNYFENTSSDMSRGWIHHKFHGDISELVTGYDTHLFRKNKRRMEEHPSPNPSMKEMVDEVLSGFGPVLDHSGTPMTLIRAMEIAELLGIDDGLGGEDFFTQCRFSEYGNTVHVESEDQGRPVSRRGDSMSVCCGYSQSNWKRMNNDESSDPDPTPPPSSFLAELGGFPQYTILHLNSVIEELLQYWHRQVIKFQINLLMEDDSSDLAGVMKHRSIKRLVTAKQLEDYEYQSFYWTVSSSFEPCSIVLFLFLYMIDQPFSHYFSSYMLRPLIDLRKRDNVPVLTDMLILVLSWMVKSVYSLLMGYRILDSCFEIWSHRLLFWLKELFHILAVCVVLNRCWYIGSVDDALGLENVILFYQAMCSLPNWCNCLYIVPLLLDFLPFVNVYDRTYLRLLLNIHKHEDSEEGTLSLAMKPSILYMAGMNLGSVSMIRIVNLERLYQIGLCFNIVYNPSVTRTLINQALQKNLSDYSPVRNIVHLSLWDLLLYIIYIVDETEEVPVLGGYELNSDFFKLLCPKSSSIRGTITTRNTSTAENDARAEDFRKEPLIDFWAMLSMLTYKHIDGSKTKNLSNLICALSQIVRINDTNGDVIDIDNNQNNSQKRDVHNLTDLLLLHYPTDGHSLKINTLDYWSDQGMLLYLLSMFESIQRESAPNSHYKVHKSFLDKNLHRKVARMVDLSRVSLAVADDLAMQGSQATVKSNAVNPPSNAQSSVAIADQFGRSVLSETIRKQGSPLAFAMQMRNDPDELTEITQQLMNHFINGPSPKDPSHSGDPAINEQTRRDSKIIGYFLMGSLYYLRSVINLNNKIDYYWTLYPYGNSSLMVDYHHRKVVPYPENDSRKQEMKYSSEQWILNRHYSYHCYDDGTEDSGKNNAISNQGLNYFLTSFQVE